MNGPRRLAIDPSGFLTAEVDTSTMLAPVECARCGHVHDAGHVEVVARYQDCSVWKCPGCGASIDDRPVGWGGGSAWKLDRQGQQL